MALPEKLSSRLHCYWWVRAPSCQRHLWVPSCIRMAFLRQCWSLVVGPNVSREKKRHMLLRGDNITNASFGIQAPMLRKDCHYWTVTSPFITLCRITGMQRYAATNWRLIRNHKPSDAEYIAGCFASAAYDCNKKSLVSAQKVTGF